MNKKYTTIAAVLLTLTLFAGYVRASQSSELISGSKTLLWITKTNPAEGDKKASFDIYARKVGDKFSSAAQSIQGQPLLMQAAGDKLHLIYSSGVYQIFEVESAGPNQGQNAPGKILATCETADFAGGKGAGVLMLVQTDKPVEASAVVPKTPAIATAAATKLTAPSVPQYALYRNFGTQWQLVSIQPIPSEHLLNPPKIHLAQAGASVFRLDVWQSKNGEKQNIKLSRLENLTTWVEVTPKPTGKPLPTYPPSGKFCGIIGINDKLLLLTAGPTANEPGADPAKQVLQLGVHSYDTKQNTIPAPSPIQQDGKNLTWANTDLPKFAQSGENLAMLWKTGEGEILAESNLQGKVLQQENLADSLAALPDMERLEEISQYYLWGIMIVIGIAILWPRPRTAPKPFLLPEGVKPGNLLLRVVAFLIDSLPFVVASWFIFSVHQEIFELLRNIINDPKSIASKAKFPDILYSDRQLYASMAATTAYIIYCVIMEWRLGWTVGKRIVGLRVLADEGKAPKFREVVLRNVTKFIELSMLSPAPQAFYGILGVIMLIFPILTRYNQRLGDMMARTSVVNAKTVTKITPDDQTLNAISKPDDNASDETDSPDNTTKDSDAKK
ncbi:MAG: RDD family protein [Phycisphaerae bacterium]|nr:RDD family protein [Phycisphaerae bacterium]